MFSYADPIKDPTILPELPEVETVVRGLRPYLEGRRLVRVLQRRPDLRFPLPKNFAARLQGRRVLGIDRRAKYILVRLDGEETLLCHLGMSGRMVVGRNDGAPLETHDHVVFETDAGDVIRFNDARRFGHVVRFGSIAGLPGLNPRPRRLAAAALDLLGLIGNRVAALTALPNLPP